MKTRTALFAAALCAACLESAAALAQGSPERPVRVVVPFAPGGATDIIARIVGQKLGERLGGQVVIENKPGAGTTLGNAEVAKPKPDGYTLLFAPTPFVISQVVYPSLPYDAAKDFAPVSLLATSPFILVANVITHGVGAALGIADLGALVVGAARHGDIWRIVSFSIYGATLIMLYLASVFYLGARAPRARRLLQFFHHAAIYLLIAGTYTPFTLVSLQGAWGWTMFGLIWGLAIIGIVLKVFFFGRLGWLSTALYLLMGWLVVIAIKPVMDAVSLRGLAWLVAGGVAYTGGVVFYAWTRLRYSHAIWHLFVLAGSVCHYVAVIRYVV